MNEFLNAGVFNWALLTSLKITAVASLGLLVAWTMRRSSAANRHTFLVGVTGALLLLPVLSMGLPSWNLGLMDAPASFQAPATPSSLPAITPLAAEASPSTRVLPPDALPTASGIESAQATAPSSAAFWILWIVIAGGTLTTLWLIAGVVAGRRTIRSSRILDDARINEAISDISDNLNFSRSIQVRVSDEVRVPVVFGVLRPGILFPEAYDEWANDRLEALLYHEISHIARHDVLKQLLGRALRAVQWFNPVVWILDRRLMIERERACDDIVLQHGVSSSTYAEHLMDMASELGQRRNPVWANVAMAEGSDFKDRVLSILNPNARRSSTDVMTIAIIAFVVGGMVLPVSAFQPWRDNWVSVKGLFASEEKDKLQWAAWTYLEDGEIDWPFSAESSPTSGSEHLVLPIPPFGSHAVQAQSSIGLIEFEIRNATVNVLNPEQISFGEGGVLVITINSSRRNKSLVVKEGKAEGSLEFVLDPSVESSQERATYRRVMAALFSVVDPHVLVDVHPGWYFEASNDIERLVSLSRSLGQLGVRGNVAALDHGVMLVEGGLSDQGIGVLFNGRNVALLRSDTNPIAVGDNGVLQAEWNRETNRFRYEISRSAGGSDGDAATGQLSSRLHINGTLVGDGSELHATVEQFVRDVLTERRFAQFKELIRDRR